MYPSAILAATLGALAAASPVNVVRQFGPTGSAPYPYAASSGNAAPTGFATATGGLYPTGTSVPYPTGDSKCGENGAILCNGPSQFGICNWGQVVWRDVALGTACQNGQIVYAPGYGTAAQSSGAAAPTGY